MAIAMEIEEESGTFTGRYHHHNGYYAGDFRWVDTSQAVIRVVTEPVARRQS